LELISSIDNAFFAVLAKTKGFIGSNPVAAA